MPAVQSTYPEEIRSAVEGMVADAGLKTIVSRTVETAAGVGFGLAVVQGTADDGVIVPTATGGVFRGITVRDVTLPQSAGDAYQQYDEAALMVSGVIWVTAQEAVSAGDPVSFEVTTGQLTTIVDATHDAIPNATWETSAGIGTLAKIRLR